MEFIIDSFATPKPITFNFDQMRRELEVKLSEYRGMIYTDEQIPTAKKDVAELRRIRDLIDKERIRLKKEYTAPFTAFEAQVKELTALLDEPITLIAGQVKSYEDEKKEAKRQAIIKMWDEIDVHNVLFQNIWEEKWLNASPSLAQIKALLEEREKKIDSDIKYLEAHYTELPWRDEALYAYRETADLVKVLGYIDEMKKRMSIQPVKEETPAIDIDPDEIPSWISFEAKLTVAQAKALNAWLTQNHIEFNVL